jgi:predicted protein tyrosine phosphatase
VALVGLNPEGGNADFAELLEWAGVIFVME